MSAVATSAPLLVFFSSTSGNTARFIQKLGLPASRIPLHPNEPPLVIDEPFVLVTPTYGGGQGRGEEKGAVPKQVVRFLNDERNRRHLRGSSPRGTRISASPSVSPATSSAASAMCPTCTGSNCSAHPKTWIA